MIEQAHAKINLVLNVVGKRADGYHELEMIMVPLTLHDTITIERSAQDCFTCDQETLPMDHTNTIVKAVEVMRKRYQFDDHFNIHVEKHIPMQAGLAGGSADAAAVMRGINQVLELHIEREELAQVGKEVGADVPFCVYQTPSLVKGIGEQITPIEQPFHYYIYLVKPAMGVSTGKAFASIDFDSCDHPDVDEVLKQINHADYEGFCHSLGNTLEQSAFAMVEEIAEIKSSLLKLGFDVALMSGSGSTVFGITRCVSVIEKANTFFEASDYFLCTTKIL